MSEPTPVPGPGPVTFPQYPAGQIHVPTTKEMGQMTKILGSRLAKMPRAPKPRGKGIQSNQKVKIGRKKTKWY